MADADHTSPEGFEWDEAKRRTNLAKHGIDFIDATVIFRGHVHIETDNRREYGERRWLAYGEMGDGILAIVYALRDGRRRLISARRARANERKTYHEGLPRGG